MQKRQQKGSMHNQKLSRSNIGIGDIVLLGNLLQSYGPRKLLCHSEDDIYCC